MLTCCAIASQFGRDGLIALFDLAFGGHQMRIIDERHYSRMRRRLTARSLVRCLLWLCTGDFATDHGLHVGGKPFWGIGTR